uniref:ATP synthase subunit a n=1 Tax=Ptyodactylus guttatus TaxID=502503 RepID=A0A1Y1CCV3_9SAUR|nr:ATP synthase F0 subunit 6 [Ptyodactylus guttatus]BAX77902.1 ATPase subunit 6 [Ptyodactylus guttatus]
MTMNLFDQFSTPCIFAIPLSTLATLLPTLLLTPSNRLITNRYVALQLWALTKFTKHLLSPLTQSGRTWAALLLTVMFFLTLTNLLGLLPYTFTPTTQLSLNMSLAVPLWLATVLIGLRCQTTTSLAHMLPTGTPTLLVPALIIIETISLMIRPLALGVRLTANLTAGHLLMSLISMATISLSHSLPTISSLTLVLLLLLTALEIAVAMIQAYVFVLLLSLYLQENT